MKVAFDHSRDETADITTFFFKPEAPINYTAGQFIELTIKHEHADSRGERRWFTLSSTPTDELVSITTKFAARDGSSFKAALRALQPGQVITMNDPMGDFVLPKLIQTPLIFVAAGIGITPFHSILSWLAETGEHRQIKLLHAVHSEDEIVFQDTFEKANQHATILVKHPTPAWGGERGELSAELILGLEQPSDDTLVYISGPEPLVETLQAQLEKAGVKKHQLVLDFFPNYTEL